MATDIKCLSCSGSTYFVGEEGSVGLLKCAECGNEFSVRIHFIEEPIALETKVYKAYIDASNPALVRKLQMKAKNVFEGYTNFYPEDLDKQFKQGLKSWDLGFYSGQEVEKLLQKAEKIGLGVRFILQN